MPGPLSPIPCPCEDAPECPALSTSAPPGAQGPPGAAATVAVDGVTVLDPGSTPTVTNVGSTSAALLRFGLPAGVAGAAGGQGTRGWTPVFNLVADGARRVFKLVGYTGGTGDAPTANLNQYLGSGGYVSLIGSGYDVRGLIGPQGNAGADGEDGWSQSLVPIVDGDRIVMRLEAWVGGTGATPPGVGKYVGAAGLVTDIADAVDFRGAPGAPGGPPGPSGRTVLNGAGAPSSGDGANGDFWIKTTGPLTIYGPKASGAWPSGVVLQGTNGSNGSNGTDGWSPVYAVVTDGARRVLQVASWAGGTGSPPASPRYVGATGLTTVLADGVDVRGPQGPAGADGTGGGGGSSPASYVRVSDTKPYQTSGGTATAGAYQTRDLNTIDSDVDGVVVGPISANQITLPAGTYYTRISAPAFQTFQHRAILRDVTNGITLLIGTEECAFTSGSQTASVIAGFFTLTADTALEVQHYVRQTAPTNGWGSGATGFSLGGDVEIYTVAEFWLGGLAIGGGSFDPASPGPIGGTTPDVATFKGSTPLRVIASDGTVLANFDTYAYLCSFNGKFFADGGFDFDSYGHNTAHTFNNGTMTVLPTGAIQMRQGTLPTPAADTAIIGAIDVAGTAEIAVKDEAGNQTTISPHAKDAPEWLADGGEYGPDRIVREEQTFTGRLRWTNETRRARLMELMLASMAGDGRATGKIMTLTADERRVTHEESFAEYEARTGRPLVQRTWDEVQDEHRDRHKAHHAAWKARKATAKAARKDFDEPAPAGFARKPKPEFLRRRKKA